MAATSPLPSSLPPEKRLKNRKVGFVNMSLAAAVLSGLNPVVVVVGMLAWKLWVSRKHLPKGCGKIRTEVLFSSIRAASTPFFV